MFISPLSVAWALQGTVSVAAVAGLVWVYWKRRDPQLSLGYFVTPSLLGGTSNMMLAELIAQLVQSLLKWGLAGAAAVVVFRVEYGIGLAVVASIVDHLRHSYSPLNSVLAKSPTVHWQSLPITPGARTEDGLVVYRFGTSLYYANAARLMDDLLVLIGQGAPLRWMVMDCAAIGDIDYTASSVLARVVEHVQQRHARFALSSVLGPVRQQLDSYGINRTLDPDAFYETPGEALEAFNAVPPPQASGSRA